MSVQKEDNQILIPATSFNLLQYIVLVEVYEENMALCRYVLGKGSTLQAP